MLGVGDADNDGSARSEPSLKLFSVGVWFQRRATARIPKVTVDKATTRNAQGCRTSPGHANRIRLNHARTTVRYFAARISLPHASSPAKHAKGTATTTSIT